MKEIFMFNISSKLYGKDYGYGEKYPSEKKITGGKRYFFPWKNTWKGGFEVRDGCTTEIAKYIKELKQYAKHCWELTSDEYYDKIIVNFMDKDDLIFFKMRWG